MTEIAGGTASNIVPVPCWFGWEIRALPGFDHAALDARLRRFAAEHCLPEMLRIAPEAGIEITITNQVPAFGADATSGIVPLALKLAGQNETFAVSYATEAGLFQLGGAPVRRVRPRQHRPGPHPQRVRARRRAGQVPALHRPRRIGRRAGRGAPA